MTKSTPYKTFQGRILQFTQIMMKSAMAREVILGIWENRNPKNIDRLRSDIESEAASWSDSDKPDTSDIELAISLSVDLHFMDELTTKQIAGLATEPVRA